MPLRRRGFAFLLTAAESVSDLIACLAFERAYQSADAGEPIGLPSAVPLCDFLMLKDAKGALAGVCRVLPGPARLSGSLSSARFQPSPLLIALRYARRVLEVGEPCLLPDVDPAPALSALWDFLHGYLERRGLAFVLGRMHVSGSRIAAAIPGLLDRHGLTPDLALEAQAAFCPPPRMPQADGPETPQDLPAPLREALRRGCRLAGVPAAHAGGHEFVFVAAREMLEAPAVALNFIR